MHYRIKHITEYEYQESVSHCYNQAHVIPRSTYRQTCYKNHVTVNPATSVANRREDYFGNLSYHFEIQRPHRKLKITAVSEVETKPQPTQHNFDFGISCSEALRLINTVNKPDNILAREYLLESPMIKWSDELKAYASDCFSEDRPLLSAVAALTKKIYTDFEYSPKSTTIATPIRKVFEIKRGVCQDFAHLQIACLRALGFPAKYVSGYIETLPPPGVEKLVGADASHAWISVYSPSEGWVEFDPTNDTIATEQHIITAWGRDFHDVTPLKGTIYGGGEEPILKVSVDVQQIG